MWHAKVLTIRKQNKLVVVSISRSHPQCTDFRKMSTAKRSAGVAPDVNLGIRCAQTTQARVSTLALKPRAYVIISSKQGYQWPHKNDWCPPTIQKSQPHNNLRRANWRLLRIDVLDLPLARGKLNATSDHFLTSQSILFGRCNMFLVPVSWIVIAKFICKPNNGGGSCSL